MMMSTGWTQFSSLVPSQSSSMLLQVLSSAAGAPGVQLFCTTPATHEVVPDLTHAPTPQVVGAGTYASSIRVSPSSSTPSQSSSGGRGGGGQPLLPEAASRWKRTASAMV